MSHGHGGRCGAAAPGNGETRHGSKGVPPVQGSAQAPQREQVPRRLTGEPEQEQPVDVSAIPDVAHLPVLVGQFAEPEEETSGGLGEIPGSMYDPEESWTYRATR